MVDEKATNLAAKSGVSMVVLTAVQLVKRLDSVRAVK
jgi:hypothetical protein